MWPFSKVVEVQELPQFVVINGNIYYLDCDDELFQKSLETIKEKFAAWIATEIYYVSSTNQPIENHLIPSLRDIDVKFLPYDKSYDLLLRILTDTIISRSSSRLMDVILNICIAVPQEVIRAITARFILSLTSYIHEEINGVSLPTYEDWEKLLIKMPWIPLLPILQEMLDTKEISEVFAEYTAQRENKMQINKI